MQNAKFKIGDLVEVIQGKHKGKVGILKYIAKRLKSEPRGRFTTRVFGDFAEVVIELSDGTKIAPQYKFVELAKTTESKGYARGDLVRAQEKFEGKWIKIGAGAPRSAHIRCLATLVYKEEGQIFVNCVHQGSYTVVPLEYVVLCSRPDTRGSSLV
ncbi:hypothetical protein PS2_010 [Serratia phage PS2]|uniref:KOW domain-containing protein n=1 Tax=Serratia phage PS2 TaxID=1481112 RepID=A0A023W613_9CAUD|nr:MotB-like transcriptional regulator [Serratia phage PS2]AHY25261.1 hypothetical protein PS2_010 [Serratia phage PS2]